MHPVIGLGFVAAVVAYIATQLLLHTTQSPKEPRLLATKIPFIDPALGILKNRAGYLTYLQ